MGGFGPCWAADPDLLSTGTRSTRWSARTPTAAHKEACLDPSTRCDQPRRLPRPLGRRHRCEYTLWAPALGHFPLTRVVAIWIAVRAGAARPAPTGTPTGRLRARTTTATGWAPRRRARRPPPSRLATAAQRHDSGVAAQPHTGLTYAARPAGGARQPDGGWGDTPESAQHRDTALVGRLHVAPRPAIVEAAVRWPRREAAGLTPPRCAAPSTSATAPTGRSRCRS
jgi:hypothetical protein